MVLALSNINHSNNLAHTTYDWTFGFTTDFRLLKNSFYFMSPEYIQMFSIVNTVSTFLWRHIFDKASLIVYMCRMKSCNL